MDFRLLTWNIAHQCPVNFDMKIGFICLSAVLI